MQARTVLLPAPDAPKRPMERPWSRFNWTSMLSSRRFLTMCALSMALALGEDVNQPGERQRNSQEQNQQRHYRRQAKALQIHPELNRHAGRVISCHYDSAKLANRADPGNTERYGQPQFREWQRHTQKDPHGCQPEQGSLFLQHHRN